MPKPPFDHFGPIAGLYDRLAGQLDTAELAARLALPVYGWLLDAGGGTGRVAAALRPHIGAAVVLDFSLGMLRRAARKPNIHAVRGAVEALPFPDGFFERIVVVDAFHHFHDHHRAAQELWRVLAPGGRLVIEEPNIHHLPVKAVALLERLLLMRSRFFPPEAMAEMFTHPNARVQVDTDHRFRAWVIVEKLA